MAFRLQYAASILQNTIYIFRTLQIGWTAGSWSAALCGIVTPIGPEIVIVA